MVKEDSTIKILSLTNLRYLLVSILIVSNLVVFQILKMGH